MSTDTNTSAAIGTDGVVRHLHTVNLAAEQGQGGSVHTRAREAVNPSVNGDSEGSRARLVRMRRCAAVVVGRAHPPNVTTERPPSWQELGWRARFGDQTATDGWTRTAAVGFAFVVTWPVRVLAFYADWIARTPSRFFVAVVLYAVLALARPPYLGWLPFPWKGDL